MSMGNTLADRTAFLISVYITVSAYRVEFWRLTSDAESYGSQCSSRPRLLFCSMSLLFYTNDA